MHRNVEALIGRLATDPELQRRFAEHPLEVIEEQRLELTAIEIGALARLDPEVLRAFTAALDARLRRASDPTATRTAGGETPEGSRGDPRKEMER
jgi:hypothetical protein